MENKNEINNEVAQPKPPIKVKTPRTESQRESQRKYYFIN